MVDQRSFLVRLAQNLPQPEVEDVGGCVVPHHVHAPPLVYLQLHAVAHPQAAHHLAHVQHVAPLHLAVGHLQVALFIRVVFRLGDEPDVVYLPALLRVEARPVQQNPALPTFLHLLHELLVVAQVGDLGGDRLEPVVFLAFHLRVVVLEGGVGRRKVFVFELVERVDVQLDLIGHRVHFALGQLPGLLLLRLVLLAVHRQAPLSRHQLGQVHGESVGFEQQPGFVARENGGAFGQSVHHPVEHPLAPGQRSEEEHFLFVDDVFDVLGVLLDLGKSVAQNFNDGVDQTGKHSRLGV